MCRGFMFFSIYYIKEQSIKCKQSFTILLCIGLAAGSTSILASDVLPFTGETCRHGTQEQINASFSTFDMRTYAYGKTESFQIFFQVSKNHKYLYIFSVSSEADLTSLCLIGGGREADLAAIDFIPDLASRWGKRKSRYHEQLASRALGKKIPIDLDNMPIENLFIGMTAYFVKSGWGNTYDEQHSYKISGKDVSLSRGEMMQVANTLIAKMDLGESPVDNEERSFHLRILDLVDHKFNPIILLIDRSDDDWALVHVDRQKKKTSVLFKGKDLKFVY